MSDQDALWNCSSSVEPFIAVTDDWPGGDGLSDGIEIAGANFGRGDLEIKTDDGER